ncbi:MAG: hypothetical protein DRJ05_04715 [Bacteroidetes bacterium]|nr:MAG: hypothetical protein DRJ05_04715 [Bacteroidota bacterium]
MNYKIIIIGLVFSSGLFINKSLVAQSTTGYLLADNLSTYSMSSNPQDYKGIDIQEEDILCEGGFSETNLVVRKGKRRGKGKGGYSFKINLEYDLPEKVMSGSTFLFKCKITKGDLKGLAKLTQRLPMGFDIVESAIGEAKTKYSNYTLNLVWDEVPMDSVIEISYNVVVNRSYGYLPISSILYFEETGKKYLFNTHVLVEKDQPPEDLIVYVPPEKKTKTNTAVIKKTEKEPIPEVNANYVPTHKPITVSPASTTIEKPIENGKGITYSIQILALMYNNVEPENLNWRYNIPEKIKVEKYQNWRKYTVGDFSSINEAKVYLKTIRDKGLIDAFIVGYEDGYRFLVR